MPPIAEWQGEVKLPVHAIGDSAHLDHPDDSPKISAMRSVNLPVEARSVSCVGARPSALRQPLPTAPARLAWSMCVLWLLTLAVMTFYFCVRIRFTIPGGGGLAAYSAIFMALEVLHAVNILSWLLWLVRMREYPELGSPADAALRPLTRAFHVRVLIPCLSEGLDIVRATADAVLDAGMPKGCRRTVYILDDGADPVKRAWVAEHGSPSLQYISGRQREPGEINGKANNLNNALTTVVYPPGQPIPMEEVVCVMDADQVMSPDFFMATLPWMQHDRHAIVLTPQHFHNYSPATDIFNHSNKAFWDITLPGQDAWGLVSCAGSNFLLRAQPAAQVGWFPNYTMTEDFALALELQVAGCMGCYVPQVLAVGEVPVTLRGCFMQRSRWCKGGMQIWFSRFNPLLRRGLSIGMRLLWCTNFWGYFFNIAATVGQLIVPLIGVFGPVFPIKNSLWFALAITLYVAVIGAMTNIGRCRTLQQELWFANLASTNLWYTFAKATFNTLVSRISNKPRVFKSTVKSATVHGSSKPKGKPSAVRDLWVPALTLLLCLAGVGVGIWRLFPWHHDATQLKFSLLVSVLWCLSNALPPYLLLHFAALGDAMLAPACTVARYSSVLLVIGAVVATWLLIP